VKDLTDSIEENKLDLIDMEFPISQFDRSPIGLMVLKKSHQSLPILYKNATAAMLFPEILGDFSLLPSDHIMHLWVHSLCGIHLPEETTHNVQDQWIQFIPQWGTLEDQDVIYIWMIDLSSNIEMQQKLENAVKQADTLAQNKSNFLATMSHEIRTPMQSVFGFLELIEGEIVEDSTLRMVSLAKESSCGLLEILDEILDFAKMDADQTQLDHFEVPVRSLVRSVTEALSIKTRGKNLIILNEVSQDVPAVIIGDPKRLRQILLNLLGNALKFTHEGRVILRVSHKINHLKTPENKQIGLRFEVEDTGIGMSDETMARLFRPFQQADNSTSRQFGGTGLGLSICKKLVELMGGKIGVTHGNINEKPDQRGSLFWFEIITESIDVDENSLILPDLTGLSVLSVEPHAIGANEITRSLSAMGAHMHHVLDFDAATNILEQIRFDVVITEHELNNTKNNCNGLKLLQNIYLEYPSMGMLMYTTLEDNMLRHSLQAMGVSCLSKPASRIGLGQAVLDAAKKRQGKGELSRHQTILIAEDTPNVRILFEKQLKKLNVQYHFAHNGLDALKIMDVIDFGLVITDLHMPEMDGYGLVRAIKDSYGSHIPVIAMTADVQMADRSTYQKHGFDEALIKPISIGQMKRLLDRWGIKTSDNTENPTSPTPTTKPDDGIPSIDRDMVIRNMGAWDQDAIEMIQLFIEFAAEQIQNLQETMKANDLTSIAEIAHSLKGGARSAGCAKLGHISETVQDQAEKGTLHSDLILQAVAEYKNLQTLSKELQ
jgi:signal transduction histidine kinase/CheY-like chemotaxis protein